MVFGSKRKSKAAEKKAPAAKPKKTTKKSKSSQASATRPSTRTMGERQVALPTEAAAPAEEIYVDGVSSLFFRAGVVKIDCYRIVGHDPQSKKELSRLSHRLVMPATSLNDLVQLLQNAMKAERQKAPSKGS